MNVERPAAQSSAASGLLTVAMPVMAAFLAPCMALGWVILQAVTLLR